jgi:hypothetical protein
MSILETIVTPHYMESLLAENSVGWGASTGYMEADRDDWPALLRNAASVSTVAVELSALSGPELDPLAAALASTDALDDFAFVSVHAPSKRWPGTASELADSLLMLPAIAQGFVLHPDALPDLRSFSVLGERLWLENMDRRKHDARTVLEMARCFEQVPEARWCFDIAHAAQLDRSMGLAHELLDAFDERLAEVHLSSIQANGTHVPLTTTDARRFRPVLERCLEVPWILEAPLPPSR